MIDDIIQTQISLFPEISRAEILDKYKLGPCDLILNFNKQGVNLVGGAENLKKNLVSVRAVQLSQIYMLNPLDIDLTVPVCLSDSCDEPIQEIPALVFTKERYSNNILIPSLNNLIGYPELNTVAQSDLPLEDKEDKMCFISSLTNIYWNNKGIQNNQRLIVADLAAKNPDLFFCGIAEPPLFDTQEWVRVSDEVYNAFPLLYKSGIFGRAPARIPEQLKYKFQITVDGHSCAWSRVVWQMASNSVVLKVRNRHYDFVEWFYNIPEFYNCVVEIDEDSLIPTFNLLQKNPSLQKDLSARASKFVNNYLHPTTARSIFVSMLYELNKRIQ